MIENPGWHTHRTSVVAGHNVCMDCGEIVITPILTADDPRLVPNPLVKLRAMLSTQGIDVVLIELTNQMNERWPDYVEQLGNKYNGAPPHVNLLYDENGNMST